MMSRFCPLFLCSISFRYFDRARGSPVSISVAPAPPCIIIPNFSPLQLYTPPLFSNRGRLLYPRLPLHERAFWVFSILISIICFFCFFSLSPRVFAWVWRSGGCYATYDPPESVMTT